jgi:O-antigen ligase
MNENNFLLNARVQKKLHLIFTTSIILSCFFINLPTAWLTFSILLIISMFFLTGNFAERFKKIINHPGGISVICLFFLFVGGTLYSNASWDIKLEFLIKYSKILLVPILICSVNSEKIRSYSINFFILSSLLVLLISYGKWLHIFPVHIGIHDIGNLEHGYAAFKNRISHNIFMSFAMYIFLIKAVRSKKFVRISWIILTILTFFNIMYLVNGRTGQVICLSLLFYFSIKQFKKILIPLLLILCVCGLIFKAQLKLLLPERLTSISHEISDMKINKQMTSSGIRLVIYQNVFDISLKSPIWGYGIGALGNEYNHHDKKNYSINIKNLDNPHNQFLLTFFEMGIIGIFFLMYMFYSHWESLKRVNLGKEDYLKDMMEGLILIMLIGSLFNSMLIDAGEGRFYCIMAGLFLSAYTPKKLIKKSA